MESRTLGIIGGTGWLGRATAEALLESSFIKPDHLLISNRSGVSTFEPGVKLLADNQQLVDLSDIVVLSIRPEQFRELQINARGKLVISLMAGVSAAAISAATGADAIVRAMPNAAVEIRQSFTPWYCVGNLVERDREWVQRLFECVGAADELPDEDGIDYLSALSGTGPAFPAMLQMALTNQAVAAGIPLAIAQRAAQGVMVGGGQMLANRDPRQMIESLMAYRGVTAAALQSMADQDIESIVGRAVQAGAEVARRGL
ncbi:MULTISPECIES: pyrroline-5-carboxylate reductase family protein [Gammaproteobacteria]|uniref:pyrroline-5-carboxylate reductase family protein n=1 Tax=Gammaproteobacteria TaxID=1236 RepID=UPI001913DD26|nr:MULTISPECIES: pyrroline-5-carboxylate reductase dimerization domain-containing protein [Gammaproteobacteria]MBK5300627.1 NAD(P)-binding domain-containing protein [Bacillus sp. TH86]MBK5320396.1 NAD(P)-binding domain-containing protein [Bacillus sp. TH59]MBK5335346.1 NAD(P)-binding domain-containing protein [Bacillus sp. TH57]MBK5309434.1 NAD(P)-binding domain-containing protein [Pseudomonas sp. TH71]MBK5314895.1 NAD(P)-binding domain-containing protein [Erwinia sp. TH79]